MQKNVCVLSDTDSFLEEKQNRIKLIILRKDFYLNA